MRNTTYQDEGTQFATKDFCSNIAFNASSPIDASQKAVYDIDEINEDADKKSVMSVDSDQTNILLPTPSSVSRQITQKSRANSQLNDNSSISEEADKYNIHL